MIRLHASYDRALVSDLLYGRRRVELRLFDDQDEPVILVLDFERGRFEDFAYQLGMPLSKRTHERKGAA